MNYYMVIEKWYNRWLRLLTMLLPGRIYIALGPWHFGNFCNVFLPIVGEDQKKVLRFQRGDLWLALSHIMVNPALINALLS